MTVVRDVPVARFGSRHEAEFAAGFLENADIPYRLQFDDAGGAYFGATSVAVLWVRGEDLDDAREILDIEPPVGVGDRALQEEPLHRPDDSALDAASDRGPSTGAPRRDATSRSLSSSERLVGAALAIGFALSAGTMTGVPALLAAAGAALFGLASLLGATIRPVRGVLGFLAGDA